MSKCITGRLNKKAVPKMAIANQPVRSPQFRYLLSKTLPTDLNCFVNSGSAGLLPAPDKKEKLTAPITAF